MSACVDIEIRPESNLTPLERAQRRTEILIDFERIWIDWSSIAKLCSDVDADRDWELMGCHSFHAWLLKYAPCSRSYLYLVMGRYKELIPDIPLEELAEIPLGSAGVLASMSKEKRKHPAIRKAAKKKPKEFIEDMQALAPDQHIEARHRITLDFPVSAWSVIEATFDKYQMLEGATSLESFIEWMCSEVSEWTLHADHHDKGRADDPDEKIVQ